jgi:hypothetical protein
VIEGSETGVVSMPEGTWWIDEPRILGSCNPSDEGFTVAQLRRFVNLVDHSPSGCPLRGGSRPNGDVRSGLLGGPTE